MKAANTVKKVLAVNSKAPATLECVGDNQIDISVLVTLEEFEKAIEESGLMKRLEAMIMEGLKGMDIAEIEAVEAIGGASRVRSVQAVLMKVFGEQKITRRMNPDEAIGFGLGWMGAIRSIKYKIPYEINLTDLITHLENPITFHVFNEQGELVFAKPLEMFKNGEAFPKSKKVALRFQPGTYRA